MWPIEEIPSCDSTQTWAFSRIAANMQQPSFAAYTLAQTAGVGRQGHAWLDCGQGLALSLAWRVSDMSAGWPAWVSLFVIEALEVVCGPLPNTLGLKWPNDLMAQGKKLGGVLVHQKRVHGQDWLVAGVGLNLRWVTPPPLDMQATDLAEVLGVATDPARLVRVIVERCEAGVAQPEPGKWAERFHALDVYRGQEVVIRGAQGRGRASGLIAVGRHAGIDAQGRIGLQTETGVAYYGLGELSLRSWPGAGHD